MAQIKNGSAGVTAKEIDISGPTTQKPTGVPAGVIGTSVKGPAFVPITVGNLSDFYAKFGQTDGKKFGPLAVVEWLRNARSVTYLRVLGAGDGRERDTTSGVVTSAGFVVGERQPNSSGVISANPYANANGDLGRTYFLGCFMSESAGSTYFSEAGLQGAGSITPGLTSSFPVIRGVVMAPSGVVLRLSSSVYSGGGTAPTSTTVGSDATAVGSALGSVVLLRDGSPRQEFTLFLNGHIGSDALYPNVITASFDPTSDSYITKALNTDPTKLQQAGHYLYASWDVHPTLAAVTGSGVVSTLSGSGANGGVEPCAFIVTSSLGRNVGGGSTPNYENFQDRFGHAASPWIVSQRFGGRAQNLFRLHALDDGAGISTRFKVSIENITVSNDPLNRYGSFSVVLREWTDRDVEKMVMPTEVFNGVNLDPTSERYIAKVIGDVHAYFDFDREESEQKLVVEGNYENRSNLIRVEVHPDVENGFVDPTALPMGFRGHDHLVTSGSSPLQSLPSNANLALDVDDVTKRALTPPVPFRRKITTGAEWTTIEQVEPKFYWGVQFEHPSTLLRKNDSVLPNDSVKSFAKYFPNFALGEASFLTGSNAGQAVSTTMGILDSDVFCNNFFTLENVQVVTGSNGLADPKKWLKAVYARNGQVTSTNSAEIDDDGLGDENKLRGLRVEDIPTNKQYAKFSFFLQGGFDGVNVFDTDEAAINNNAVAADMDAAAGRASRPEEGPNVRTYLKALDIVKNVVNLDVQILAIPGIREPLVTDAATLAVEERFDALYVMDIEQQDENGDNVTSDSQLPSVTNTLTAFTNRSVDSSFAAAYFPDVLYKDPKGVNVFAPPSVLVLGALALNDRLGHPWFAPAGFARGALPDAALEARVKLSQGDMDKLYDASINPLVSFPGAPKGGFNPKGSVLVWGQKTLQVAASALDRVNVRRLLIDIRRQVRDIAQVIIFEPSRESTLAKFSSLVKPRLERIQRLSGLDKFKVVIDASTTSQDDVLNNTLRGKIFVVPTKTNEFVSLDFVVANNINQVTLG
jgi:phage tail sheath protein FI